MLVLSGIQWKTVQSVQWKINMHIMLDMVMRACNASISKVKQDEQEFKVILSYLVTWRNVCMISIYISIYSFALSLEKF